MLWCHTISTWFYLIKCFYFLTICTQISALNALSWPLSWNYQLQVNRRSRLRMLINIYYIILFFLHIIELEERKKCQKTISLSFSRTCRYDYSLETERLAFRFRTFCELTLRNENSLLKCVLWVSGYKNDNVILTCAEWIFW